MKRIAVALAGALALGTALGFTLEEDFSIVDACGNSPAIDVERNTSLTHRHGWVEDGAYRIAVDGNRHFFATPPLGDFSLRLDFELIPFKRLDLTLGMKVFFRYDRVRRAGEELDVYFDRFRKLHFELNGRELDVSDGAATLSNLVGRTSTLVLAVKGREGTAEAFGRRVAFTLEDRAAERAVSPSVAGGGSAKGMIGFDQTLNEGSKLLLKKITLASPENPPKREVGRWNVELPRSQGSVTPPRYSVVAERYESGELEISAELGGLLPEMPKREKCGGEWSAMSERVESPYVRVGERKFYFWNGLKVLRTSDKGGAGMPWPCKRRWLLPSTSNLQPPTFNLSVGYEHLLMHPWRFAENGPYEAVYDGAGKLLYVGSALGKGKVTLEVKSPEDKALTALIPPDIPRREDALDHARRGHYFLETETSRFTLSAVFAEADFSPDEITLAPRLETVYGDKSAIAVTRLGERRTESLGGGLRCVRETFALAENPGVGVWHLETDFGAAPRRAHERTVFEVLPKPDDACGSQPALKPAENAQRNWHERCPPLASGLPVFVSVPNEIAYLEESAFDPHGDLGGAAHYYSIDMRYPAVGERLRIRELDHLYSRRYFTWVNRRNAKDLDMNSEGNRRLMRNCDYFGGYPNGKHQEGRFDFAQMRLSGPFQRQVIDDYLAERNLGWKIEGVLPTDAEFKRLFDSGWDAFKTYAKGRVDRYMKDFVDYLLSVNPRLARASYGPMPVYTARYKSPYTCEYDSHPIEDDKRLKANGSFFLFEDYHYSCDYPLCRPAYFVAAYLRLHPDGRYIYPEIYYPGFGRCADGAVYQAHPDRYPHLAHTHQRRIAYQYACGTPYAAPQGGFAYWTDYGFHARTPRTADMDEFLHAWGRIVKHPPARPVKSPAVIVDPDAFRRYGDFFEQYGAYDLRCPGFTDVRSDVNNLAEETVGYAYEQCVKAGYTTPVVATFADLDRFDATNCEFLILPPLAKSTPPEILAAIRAAKKRGVPLLGFVEACGMENELDYFMKEAPTRVERESFRQRYARGREGLSARVAAELASAFARLSPRPAAKTERGNLMAYTTAKGDIVAVLSDDSPIYNDPESYPATFRFTLSAPGLGEREIESDAPYAVVERSRDRVVLRTETDKDTALWFRFAAP